MIHYYCGTCGIPYFAVLDRPTRVVRAEPQCLAQHPLCIAIGTEDEARMKREDYSRPALGDTDGHAEECSGWLSGRACDCGRRKSL